MCLRVAFWLVYSFLQLTSSVRISLENDFTFSQKFYLVAGINAGAMFLLYYIHEIALSKAELLQ